MSQLGRRIVETRIAKEQAPRDPPWLPEEWHKAGRSRVKEPEKRYPVIISSSTGVLRTARHLQELAGLPSLPCVLSTTIAPLSDKVDRAGRGNNGKEPERVQYCEVNWEQLAQIYERTNGEDVIVWFQGEKRFAWLARSVKPGSEHSSSDRK